MPDPRENDLKLLDRALERHALSRQTWLRDLKIAATIGTVFLFGIFFRFIDLSDKRLALDIQRKEVADAQAIVASVKQGLGQIGKLIQLNGTKVAADVTAGRDTLRQRIVAVFQAFNDIKSEGAARNPASKTNMVIQKPLPINALDAHGSSRDVVVNKVLAGLTPPQITLIKRGDSQDLIHAIINDQIVPRVFADLNQAKVANLDSPVNAAIAAIGEQLKATNSILRDIKWDPKATANSLAKVSDAMHKFEFKPPTNGVWWETVASKGEVFSSLNDDAQTAFNHFQVELDAPKQTLDSLEASLTSLASEIGRNTSDLDSQAKEIDHEINQVSETIAGVAKPWAAVALEPGTIIPYAPAILAAALVYFLVCFESLRRNRTELMRACQALGYADQVIAVYFDDGMNSAAFALPALTLHWTRKRVAILFAIPALAILVAGARVLMSPSMSQKAPMVLYVPALLALTVTYIRAVANARQQDILLATI